MNREEFNGVTNRMLNRELPYQFNLTPEEFKKIVIERIRDGIRENSTKLEDILWNDNTIDGLNNQ